MGERTRIAWPPLHHRHGRWAIGCAEDPAKPSGIDPRSWGSGRGKASAVRRILQSVQGLTGTALPSARIGRNIPAPAERVRNPTGYRKASCNAGRGRAAAVRGQAFTGGDRCGGDARIPARSWTAPVPSADLSCPGCRVSTIAPAPRADFSKRTDATGCGEPHCRVPGARIGHFLPNRGRRSLMRLAVPRQPRSRSVKVSVRSGIRPYRPIR